MEQIEHSPCTPWRHVPSVEYLPGDSCDIKSNVTVTKYIKKIRSFIAICIDILEKIPILTPTLTP